MNQQTTLVNYNCICGREIANTKITAIENDKLIIIRQAPKLCETCLRTENLRAYQVINGLRISKSENKLERRTLSNMRAAVLSAMRRNETYRLKVG